MTSSHRNILSGALAAIGLSLTASAQATLLLPGAAPLAVDIVASAPGGTVLATATTPIVTAHWSGTARAAVVDGPEPGVNLDFYYQFTNSAGSNDSIGRITGSDFPSQVTTNAFQTANPFGIFVSGNQSATSADRDLLGTVGFNFVPAGNNKVDPGESSYTLIVRTNAVSWSPFLMGITDGIGTSAAAFQPVVPEPGTLALLVSGLLVVGGVARRRRR